MVRSTFILAAALAVLSTSPTLAQDAPAPTLPPASPATTLPLQTPTTEPPQLTPAPQPRGPSSAVQREGGVLFLSAMLGGGGGPIRSGITWRIYAEPQDGGAATLVQESKSASPSIPLDPGVYIVHAAYGLASATQRVVMGGAPTSASITLNAGGLVLGGVIGDSPIPPDKLKFNVYVPLGNDPEGRLVVESAHAGTLIRLPEGAYRVVSTYGDSNAIMSADLKVEAGKVTAATLRHKAATVTLKLVTAPGSEALANTTFSVLTPGGDTIREAIGAFPSMTLAEGEYVAIARNAGKVYTQEFSVKSGLDRDIDIITK